jgi:hypothetical protein
MKTKNAIIINLLAIALTSCSTVKQANTDFNDFCNMIKYYNHRSNKTVWNLNCQYCTSKQNCKWIKCPNKNVKLK